MVPLVLVLLVAQSAFGAPYVNVQQTSINDVAPLRDPGNLVSSYVTEGAYDQMIDGGETNVYMITAQKVINDMANTDDATYQAMAVGQIINMMAELGYGNPGDACEYSAVVDAYASGNRAAVAQTLKGYVDRVLFNIDSIAQLANDPNSLRFATGRITGCNNGGRIYNIQGAWNQIFARAYPYQIDLMNEQYCNANNMYNGRRVRTNNVGAAISAASVDAVVEIVQASLGPLSNLLRVIARGENPAEAAAIAKNAVVEAANYIAL